MGWEGSRPGAKLGNGQCWTQTGTGREPRGQGGGTSGLPPTSELLTWVLTWVLTALGNIKPAGPLPVLRIKGTCMERFPQGQGIAYSQ